MTAVTLLKSFGGRGVLLHVVCAERLGRQMQVLNNVDHPIGDQRASRIRKPGGDQPALFSQRKRATASRSWFGSTPPFDQFSFQRNDRPQYRPSEQGDVLRKRQGAEREHPESQHRKENRKFRR